MCWATGGQCRSIMLDCTWSPRVAWVIGKILGNCCFCLGRLGQCIKYWEGNESGVVDVAVVFAILGCWKGCCCCCCQGSIILRRVKCQEQHQQHQMYALFASEVCFVCVRRSSDVWSNLTQLDATSYKGLWRLQLRFSFESEQAEERQSIGCFDDKKSANSILIYNIFSW